MSNRFEFCFLSIYSSTFLLTPFFVYLQKSVIVYPGNKVELDIVILYQDEL
jgi:hypothetical protein